MAGYGTISGPRVICLGLEKLKAPTIAPATLPTTQKEPPAAGDPTGPSRVQLQHLTGMNKSMEVTALAGLVQNEAAACSQASGNLSSTQKGPPTTGDPTVRNLEQLLALEGMNSRDEVLASAGLPQFEALAGSQHISGPSQPLEAPSRAQGTQSMTREAPNVRGSLTGVAAETLSKVLCTLEEEDETISNDEVLWDDRSSISNLQLVCNESRHVASFNDLGDRRDEPNPICSLPPTPLWADP